MNICPKCRKHVMIKRGYERGNQRYYCKPCDHYTIHPLSLKDVLALEAKSTIKVPSLSEITKTGEQNE